MEIKCVYCEMKTEFLNTVTCMSDYRRGSDW
jgi:hypothetical protein